MKNILFLICFLQLTVLAIGQNQFSDFEAKYQAAKTFYANAQYPEAIKAFDEISAKEDQNPFMPYARFYKAFAYKHLGKFLEARFVLEVLPGVVPEWPKNDEVNYLLTEVNLDLKAYDHAAQSMAKIESPNLKTRSVNMLYHYVAKEKNLQNIQKVQQAFKKDKKLAKLCAFKAQKDPSEQSDFFYQYLLQDYKLDIKEFESGKHGTKKQKYRVALLLPINKDNQAAYKGTTVLELYQGILLGFEELKSKGINIQLDVYDTQKDESRVKQLIADPGFVNYDLILGPLYSETSEVVAEFAEKNKIVMFNLLNRHGDISRGKSFVFNSLSTYELIGIKMADAAVTAFDTSKDVRIYYNLDDRASDSITARAYKNRLEQLGVKIGVFKSVRKGNQAIKSYQQSLEWAKESETGHVAIFATKNNLMASTLISVWENGNKQIPVLAPFQWLEIQLISYEQFLRRKIHFVAPEHLEESSKIIKDFKEAYHLKMGVKPINLMSAATGYSTALFCGEMLDQYGTFFHHQLLKSCQSPALLIQGADYSSYQSNGIVPLLKFDEDLNFVWLNKPKKE